MYVPHVCANGCKVVLSKDKSGQPCPNCGAPLTSLQTLRGVQSEEVFWTKPKFLALRLLAILAAVTLVMTLLFSSSHEARQAVARLDPARNPNPVDRIAAIKVILELALADQKLSGWQQIQRLGCRDPDAKVRITALHALGEFAQKKSDQVVVGSMEYIDSDAIGAMGRSDPSPEVRIAVADFWLQADVFWKTGIDSLEEMLGREQDPEVLAAIREALTQRVDRSRKHGDLDAQTATRLRERHRLSQSTPTTAPNEQHD